LNVTVVTDLPARTELGATRALVYISPHLVAGRLVEKFVEADRDYDDAEEL